MDVDSLRAELEKHLKKNPHPDAPDGFRDRFDMVAEQYVANEDDIPKAALEEQLQQIRDEAEAAANAAGTDSASGEAGVEAAAAGGAASGAADGSSVAANDTASAPSPGFLPRYGIALVPVLIVLVAAYLYFR